MEAENNSKSSSASKIIPEKVMEGVRRTLANIDELQSKFDEFLSLASDPDVLSQLPPLERAQSLLLLSKLTSVLLSGNYKLLNSSFLLFNFSLFSNLIFFYESKV